MNHRFPPLLLALLALLPLAGRAAEGLPPLDALEALPGGGVLGVCRQRSQLLLLEASPDDSTAGFRCRIVAGPGAGPGSLENPGEADARLGLQVLVLDTGRRGIVQYTRELAFQGREEISGAAELPRPEWLALSAGRALVVGDARSGSLAVRRPGEEWRPLLDFARSGRLRPASLEAVGERVFVVDAAGPPRLLLCGTEGGWRESWDAPGLLAVHRDGERDLLLLFRRGAALELERWPEAHALSRLPSSGRVVEGRYDAPPALAEHDLRDFLLLTDPPRAGWLLLAPAGAPACLAAPLEPGP